MAFLQIEKSDGQVKEFELQLDRVVIGRSPDADVVVPDSRVSRHHAVLQRNPTGQWELQDLGSRNKTFIGTQAISSQVLHNGDVLSIGGVHACFLEKISSAGSSIRATSSKPSPETGIKVKPVFCPECNAAVGQQAVLCVNCGYNLLTGKKMAGTASKTPTKKGGSESDTICPCCEQSLPSNSKVCVQCGIDIHTGRAIQTIEDGHLDKVYMYAESIISVISWVFGIGVYPIASEAFGMHKPWIIRGIAVLTILISGWFMVAYIYNSNPEPSVTKWMHWCGSSKAYQQKVNSFYNELKEAGLTDQQIRQTMEEEGVTQVGQYRPYQLITCVFLHGGILHLAGNLLFLMILGSRVNAMIGNLLTLLIYPLLGIAASFIHMMATANQPLFPSLGASGAIMGLAGVYLVLMPIPNIHMAAWCRWGLIGGFHLNMKLFAVRGFWVVLFYIAFDVIYTIFGLEDNVAHWAHLGGFLSGMGIGFILLVFRVVNARGGDLLSVLLGKRAWAIIGKPNHNGSVIW
jgi:membrane associated rhomboid family serine protease/pSer/pThr/pTyr-binding forkhead associated (FHA) protein